MCGLVCSAAVASLPTSEGFRSGQGLPHGFAAILRVAVPGKPADDLAPGTLNSILKQAGLKQ